MSDKVKIELSLKASAADKLYLAALAEGMTLEDYAVAVLLESVDEILDEHGLRKISARDGARLASIIKNGAAPNDSLKLAASRYRTRFRTI